MRGSQNGLSQDISQQPRQTRVRRGPLRPQEPVTSQVTTAPCRGSRGQTSSDGPIASVSANRPDATWPDEPSLFCTETGNGRMQAYPAAANMSSRITAGQSAPVTGTSRCACCQMEPHRRWLVT